MGDAILFEEQQRPLVVIRFVGAPTDPEFEAYLCGYDRLLAGDDVYALMLVTAPDAPMTRARHARRQARWMAENVRLARDPRVTSTN